MFRMVLDRGIWPLPVADRVLLSEFITIQLLRGRNHRRSIEQMASLLMTAQVASAGRQDLVKRMREVQGQDPDDDERRSALGHGEPSRWIRDEGTASDAHQPDAWTCT